MTNTVKDFREERVTERFVWTDSLSSNQHKAQSHCLQSTAIQYLEGLKLENNGNTSWPGWQHPFHPRICTSAANFLDQRRTQCSDTSELTIFRSQHTLSRTSCDCHIHSSTSLEPIERDSHVVLSASLAVCQPHAKHHSTSPFVIFQQSGIITVHILRFELHYLLRH